MLPMEDALPGIDKSNASLRFEADLLNNIFLSLNN